LAKKVFAKTESDGGRSLNHDLIWRGAASKTIDPKADPDKQRKNLAKAVEKL
jgi:hypothetical protein